MWRKTHPGPLTLLIALSLVGCSKPAATPKVEGTPAASSPAPTANASSPASTPQASASASTSSAVDPSIAANVGDPAKFREVMTSLQQAVRNHDASAVAALVSYPVDINPHTKQVVHVRTPADFVAQYDSIITPHIADVIAKQKYEDLFVNDQGAMFGSGEVWISGICKDKTCKQVDIKVRTIQNTTKPTP